MRQECVLSQHGGQNVAGELIETWRRGRVGRGQRCGLEGVPGLPEAWEEVAVRHVRVGRRRAVREDSSSGVDREEQLRRPATGSCRMGRPEVGGQETETDDSPAQHRGANH